MTATDPTPLVHLALRDPDQNQRWGELLEQGYCRVKIGRPEDLQWDAAGVGSVDALLIGRPDLPAKKLAKLRDILSSVNSCGVVLLEGDLTPMGRARLMATGVRKILDGKTPLKDNVAGLEAVAKAEAEEAPECPDRVGHEVQPRLADFLSRSPFMSHFLRTVRKVADARATLLITGETGVGKERLARAIHAESSRAEKPFIAVNCGAVTSSLAESELFGHVKGAFTGASQDRRGPFELADGGTLLLDEVGEMDPDLQVRLLRVLERREVQRVGSEKILPVDVRVIAASNRKLEEEVREGRFREDLYFRLNVVELRIPTLRERREDLPDLLGTMVHCLRELEEDYEIESFEPEALELLIAYDWPGNVRELINVVEHAMLLSEGKRIQVASLPERIRRRGKTQASPAKSAEDAPADEAQGLKAVRLKAAQEAEREHLVELLRRTGGDLNETARLAEIGRRALFDRMRSLGLRKEDFRGPGASAE